MLLVVWLVFSGCLFAAIHFVVEYVLRSGGGSFLVSSWNWSCDFGGVGVVLGLQLFAVGGMTFSCWGRRSATCFRY